MYKEATSSRVGICKELQVGKVLKCLSQKQLDTKKRKKRKGKENSRHSNK